MEPVQPFPTIDRDRPDYDVAAWQEEERQRRVARHEAFHRIANERAVQASAASGSPTVRIFCECGDVACIELLEVPRAWFDRVRRRGDVFIVRPGHELPDLERIVTSESTHTVVEKFGLGKLVALETVALARA